MLELKIAFVCVVQTWRQLEIKINYHGKCINSLLIIRTRCVKYKIKTNIKK